VRKMQHGIRQMDLQSRVVCPVSEPSSDLIIQISMIMMCRVYSRATYGPMDVSSYPHNLRIAIGIAADPDPIG
jgi:hypothetical protein